MLKKQRQALALVRNSPCRNPYKVFHVADSLGIERAIVAAYCWVETGFRNVYGGDTGGVNAHDPGEAPMKVTKDNWPLFVAAIKAGRKTNGAGFAQGTNVDLHLRADKISDGNGWHIVAHLQADMEFAISLQHEIAEYRGVDPRNVLSWQVASAYHYGLTGSVYGTLTGSYVTGFQQRLHTLRQLGID